MESLLPYADDLFHSVFGKGLHPQVLESWRKPIELKESRPILSNTEPHFNKAVSVWLLKNFLFTLGIPRGIEYFINLIAQERLDLSSRALERDDRAQAHLKRKLTNFGEKLKEKLRALYSNYNRGFDPTGIIAVIGALCMELDASQVIPLLGKTEETTVRKLASTGLLVPYAYQAGCPRWCCPAIFYDTTVIDADYPILQHEIVLDAGNAQ